MILYDFKCSCGNEFEGLANIIDYTKECSNCGYQASRVISAPTIRLEGVTGHFPTAADKWTKMHEKMGQVES